jgi:hypothetical protein
MTFGFHNYFPYKPLDIALNNPQVMDCKVTIDTNTQPEDGSSMFLQKFGVHLRVYTESHLKTSYYDEIVVHLIEFVLFVTTEMIHLSTDYWSCVCSQGSRIKRQEIHDGNMGHCRQ